MISIAIAARFSECNVDSIDTKLHKDAYSGDVKGLKETLMRLASSSMISSPEKVANVIDKKNHLGCTALRLAATCGHDDCVKTLLYHGAKKDIADIKGQTPLFVAVKNGHVNCVDILLKHGANPEGDDDIVYTPLFLAAMNGYHAIVELLIMYGAHLSSRKSRIDRPFSNDPLQIAIAYHKYESCLVLFRAGYNPNVYRAQGFGSFYHVALKHKCDVKFLKLLYEFGVDVFVKDQKGVYPWEMKIDSDKSDVSSQYTMQIKENPRSLLSTSRLLIRHHMRDLTRIHELYVPVSLINYLNYKEI